ncbi:MAG: MFS transporter [Stappiaceae bacterium]
MGVWLHAADGLLVSTMMPAIVADIGGIPFIPWTFALYEIGSIVAGAASGLVATRYGIRQPMSVAAIVFAFGCTLSALAPEMALLLAGRLLQGLGGGGLMAISFVAASLMFPTRLIARVMGAISTIWAISAFFGPLIGGLFVEFASWRIAFWIFAVQAVILAAWLITRLDMSARPVEKQQSERFPLFRLTWLTAGVLAIAYSGINIDGIYTPVFILIGLACLALFLRLDRNHRTNRLLPENPFSLTNPIGAALLMLLCFAAATIPIGIYVPFLITKLHGISALVAGYIIAIEAITWTVMAVVLSGSPERHDPKCILIGMLAIAASIPGFAYSVAEGPLWLVAFFAALQGAGFGTAWTFMLRRATRLAPSGEEQRVSAALPTVQRLGYALGAAYIGIVANGAGIETASPGGSLEFTARAIFLSCLPLALIGLIAALRFVSPK